MRSIHQPDHEVRFNLPDTPAGRRARDWLAAFDTGDPVAMRRFLETACAPSFFKDFSIEHRLRYLLWLVRIHRRLMPYAVQHSERHKIEFHARSHVTEEAIPIIVEVGAEPDYPIIHQKIQPGLPPAISPPVRLSSYQIRRTLGRYIRRLTEADVFSGAVLIASGEDVLFEQAYGLANHSFQVTNNLDTKFCIGSMNKMFTAVITARLAQEGRLAFDDPISQYLPHLPRSIAERITLHHLLTHTSGFGSIFTDRFFTSSRAIYKTLSDYWPLLADQTPDFEPGERWQYSNVGYLLLGLIIEAVTGESYYEVARRIIYAPAMMHNTDCYEMDMPIPNLASGYTNLDLNFQPLHDARRSNLFMSLYRGTSDGGGFSTVGDLLRFSVALQSNQLLDQKHTALLLRPMLQTGRTPTHYYGYGLEQETLNGVRIVGHGGGFPGVTAQLDMFIEPGVTSVVLSNYDYPGPLAVVNYIRHLILQIE